jgi:hypothetical protein
MLTVALRPGPADPFAQNVVAPRRRRLAGSDRRRRRGALPLMRGFMSRATAQPGNRRPGHGRALGLAGALRRFTRSAAPAAQLVVVAADTIVTVPARPVPTLLRRVRMLEVIDGLHRLSTWLPATAAPPWGSASTSDLPRAGRRQFAKGALAATVLKVRAVAAWRRSGVLRHLARKCAPPSRSRHDTLRRAAAEWVVSLRPTGSLAPQADVVRAARSGPPSLSSQPQQVLRQFAWLSQRGIVRAEQRCGDRYKGDSWSSLRHRQHRRNATAQGALAGREPPFLSLLSTRGRPQPAMAA